MAEARIIKRYANRKLYDTQHSRYVTLDQISEMIRAGDDVKIVDNKSKGDLTTVTLAQIIFEEEKKGSVLPLGTMRTIIQQGGGWIAEAQRRVHSLLPGKRKDEAVDPAAATPPPESGGNSEEAVARRRRESVTALRDWIHHSKGTLDEWQRRVDERIRTAIGGISPFAGVNKDVKALADRIAELEAKLEALASDPTDGER
jgi:polyhydroxyalkanoate synthesis repressor PhaR